MPEKCWALEYARGNIASMLPFGERKAAGLRRHRVARVNAAADDFSLSSSGIWDAMFSTVDLVSLWWTVWVRATARAHTRQSLHRCEFIALCSRPTRRPTRVFVVPVAAQESLQNMAQNVFVMHKI